LSNLMLTNECNLHCEYCFAAPFFREGNQPGKWVSSEVFEQYLAYLDRSDIPQARLLGGEPTLHPDFARFVRRALEYGKHVALFTNGFMPAKALQTILELPEECCSVLVNVTPAEWQAGQGGFLKHQPLLEALGKRAQISYTLWRIEAEDLTWIIRMIEEANCSRSVRLGLAQPAGKNRYLHPKNYREAGRKAAAFAQAANKLGIKVELDCGFVRCMFSDEEIFTLKESAAHFAWRCNPVIDIDIHGNAFPCFPLAETVSMENALSYTAQEIQDHFEHSLSIYRVCGIFSECSTCQVRITEKCTGGCLASGIRRMKKQAITYMIPYKYQQELFYHSH
jgi:MoaA/NifB/PqqE/SkfB family radical SAM enzyme